MFCWENQRLIVVALHLGVKFPLSATWHSNARAMSPRQRASNFHARSNSSSSLDLYINSFSLYSLHTLLIGEDSEQQNKGREKLTRRRRTQPQDHGPDEEARTAGDRGHHGVLAGSDRRSAAFGGRGMGPRSHWQRILHELSPAAILATA